MVRLRFYIFVEFEGKHVFQLSFFDLDIVESDSTTESVANQEVFVIYSNSAWLFWQLLYMKTTPPEVVNVQTGIGVIGNKDVFVVVDCDTSWIT